MKTFPKKKKHFIWVSMYFKTLSTEPASSRSPFKRSTDERVKNFLGEDLPRLTDK